MLLAGSAIPYGTVEPWWKAAFVCGVFAICIVAIVESLLSRESRIGGSHGVLLAMLSLAVFAFVQTDKAAKRQCRSRRFSAQSVERYKWRSLPDEILCLSTLALTACLLLLYRYCASEKRINVLIHVVLESPWPVRSLGSSARQLSFNLASYCPRTMPGQGYGQFINKNHFALLMEMALGLGLGIGLTRGLTRERVLSYVALLIPIWMGLVLSNSRGGILAMLAQVVVASLLLTSGKFDYGHAPAAPRFLKSN